MGECLIIRSGGGTDTSDATATSDVVLGGYTCYVNDELVTGSMVAQNPGNQSLTPGGEYTIEEGYYDGTDEISVTSLSDNTSADATAGYILTGYNAWVNGSNVSGSMVNQGNVSQSLAANGSYTIPAGWHAGAGVVNQSLTTQGIFGVRGTFRGWVDNTYDWVNRSYSEVWNYGEGITRTFYSQTISGSTLTNLKNSFSQASFYVEVWARVQNGTWATYARLYVDNDSRAFAMASIRASVGGADNDWVSSIINLSGVSSSIRIWVYAYGSGLAPMGWSWVTSLRLRFSK